MPIERSRARVLPWVGLVTLLPCLGAGPLLAQEPPAPAPATPLPTEVASETDIGVFSFYFENDIVAYQDDDYTAGVGFSWITGDVRRHREGTPFRLLIDTFDFLPRMQDEDRTPHVSLVYGLEMYTPTDIESPVPPPGEQPYAGVQFFDTTLHARGERSMHSYTLRLGLVGPSSGAEQLQTELHKILGTTVPQGWDSQLSDEPLLNFDYRYDRRLYRAAGERRFGLDLTASGAGGAGNYYIGASAGVSARFGWGVPDTFGPIALRTGSGGLVGLKPAPDRGWRVYGYLESQLFGVARFLPTDGNTFTDSPSGPREDFPLIFTGGLVVAWNRLFVHQAFTNLGGYDEFPRGSSHDFGTLVISWVY